MSRVKPSAVRIPEIPPGIAFRIIEGEAVLVNPGDKMIYVLNRTGARAWQEIDGKTSIAEIAGIIGEEYQVTPSEAEKDIRALFGSLASRGLLSWKK